MMIKCTLLMAVLLTSMVAVFAGQPETSDVEAGILSVVRMQETAWNNHDLLGYMSGYWRSSDLTVQSGNTRVQGWDNLLARYQAKYSGDKMGHLTFSNLDVRMLAPDLALVTGRWRVKTAEEILEGLFTIILRPKDSGWKIIHDHSS